MNNSEIILFLLSIQGIGKKTVLKLYRAFGSFPSVYQAAEKELKDVLNQKQLSAFLNFRASVTPSGLKEKYRQKGISFYSILDSAFPRRFLTIPDAPLGIFVKGKLPSPDAVTVSIIGARKNSYYGEKQTKIITEKLVAENIEIVSGMARGIDGIAQRTALNSRGTTYGILGCGVNICYPPENEPLFHQIPYHGGLISEYLPDTPPCRNFFPARNRLISGLGDILIVTEAREKSGTFITVDMALEQGKEIFVLPGRMDDPLSIGCNRLISQGAHIILDPETLVNEILALAPSSHFSETPVPENALADLLEVKRISPVRHSSALQPDSVSTVSPAVSLSPTEQLLFSCLDYCPKSLDRLYREICHARPGNGCPAITDVMTAATNLCLAGLARQENGGWYTKS